MFSFRCYNICAYYCEYKKSLKKIFICKINGTKNLIICYILLGNKHRKFSYYILSYLKSYVSI